MENALSLVAKLHETCNRYISSRLRENYIDDLVPSHCEILVMLYKHNKLTMKQIADNINKTKPTVTVLVNKLEALGLIKREKSKTDSRKIYITLTDNGEDFRPIFCDITNDLNKKLYKNFSEKDSLKIETMLEKMISNV